MQKTDMTDMKFLIMLNKDKNVFIILDIGAGFHILALGLAHLLILKEFVFQMRETWNIIKKSRMFLL